LKKAVWIAGIFVSVILFPLASLASDFKIIFSVGADYRPQPGYNYSYSRIVNPETPFYPAEYGGGNDRLARAQIYAPDFGIGLFYKSFSLHISIAPFAGNYSGTYEMSIPRMGHYKQIATNSAEADSRIAGTSLWASLKYAIPLGSAVQLYAGAGINFSWAGMDLASDVVYEETFARAPEQGYVIHTLEITEIAFSPVNVDTLGWSALAGIEINPAGPYRLYLEGRYLSGRKDVPHPFYSRLDIASGPIRLDFSGFVLSIGIRYALEL